MRYYHPKGSKTPRNVYMQVKYKLKDYERLQSERADLLLSSPPPADGMPRGTDMSDRTARAAQRLAAIDATLEAIDKAALEIQAEYADRVSGPLDAVRAYWSYGYFNYMHRRTSPQDEGPSVRTWARSKDLFTYLIAKRLHLV